MVCYKFKAIICELICLCVEGEDHGIYRYDDSVSFAVFVFIGEVACGRLNLINKRVSSFKLYVFRWDGSISWVGLSASFAHEGSKGGITVVSLGEGLRLWAQWLSFIGMSSSSFIPVATLAPNQKRRGRPPVTGQKQRWASPDKSW